MARRKATMGDPFLDAMAGLGIATGRPGQVAGRFPAPGRIKTGFKMHLITNNEPDGIYYPVIYQSDLEAAQDSPTKASIFRQRQWVGGMGQRVMSDPSKFMTSAAYTMRMNEFVPQPFANYVTTGTMGGWSVGEFAGVPKKMLEWQGTGGTASTTRRVYLATYELVNNTTPTTRIYMLRSEGMESLRVGWWLWKTFTGWQYTDFTIINNELHLLGTQNGYSSTAPESYFWKAASNNQVEGDWTQGNACYEHQVTTPDGTYGSYQSTFYYPTGSVVVGSNDYGNYINNIVLLNGNIVIIKPEGIYLYQKAGNVVQLRVNLRSYFDADTGKQAIQWGQLLYFNMGKLLAGFDGEKIVILPPVWDWADPDWIPTVHGLANCGEGLGVAFNGRAAIYDGQDWHNLYRKADVICLFWTTAYKEATDHRYPMVIILTYNSTSRFVEYYPSFFRPLQPETKSTDPSFLVSSAFESADTDIYLFRDLTVRARNLSSTFGIRAWGRTFFYPDSTAGFVLLNPTAGHFGAGETYGTFVFTMPGALATGPAFQYKIEFVPSVAGAQTTLMPAVAEVSVEVRARPATQQRRWDFQVLCMDDYEFPDGTLAEKGASDMARILWEAHYQVNPVRVGFWQEATESQDACWVYRDCIIRGVQHNAYIDESNVTGYIFAIHVEEV